MDLGLNVSFQINFLFFFCFDLIWWVYRYVVNCTIKATYIFYDLFVNIVSNSFCMYQKCCRHEEKVHILMTLLNYLNPRDKIDTCSGGWTRWLCAFVDCVNLLFSDIDEKKSHVLYIHMVCVNATGEPDTRSIRFSQTIYPQIRVGDPAFDSSSKIMKIICIYRKYLEGQWTIAKKEII